MLSDGSGPGKNVIFGADMSSLVHFEKKKKDILIIGKGLIEGLGDTMLIAEKKIL